MNKNQQLILYIFLGLVGLIMFILQIFVFAYPNGIIGYFLCLLSVLLVFGSIVKICKISKKSKSYILSILDILFWLP